MNKWELFLSQKIWEYFLKVGEAEREKENKWSFNFCWERGLFPLFWFFNTCSHFKYPLKKVFLHTVNFIRKSWNLMEIRKNEQYRICVSFQINTFLVVYGGNLIFHPVDPKSLKQNGYLWINLWGLQIHHFALFLWDAQENSVIY